MTGALGIVGLAGCGGDGGDTETERDGTETERDGMETETEGGGMETETEFKDTATPTGTRNRTGTPAVEMPSLEAYYSLDETSPSLDDTETRTGTGTDIDPPRPTNTVTGTEASTIGSPTASADGIRNTAFEYGISGEGTTYAASAHYSGETDEQGNPTLPVNGDQATVAAWVNYTGKETSARIFQVGGNYQQYTATSLPRGFGGGYDVRFDGASKDIKLNVGGDGYPTNDQSGTVTLGTETWYFIVAAIESTDGTLNGTLYAFDQNGELPDSPQTVSISDTRTGQSQYLLWAAGGSDGKEIAGRMDEVYAFSESLSASDIQTLYDNSF